MYQHVFFIKNMVYYAQDVGGTRFMINLINLNFKKAFYIHPIFFMLAIYLLLLDVVYAVNIIFKIKINIFKWWHIIFWAFLLLIFTVFRNINF